MATTNEEAKLKLLQPEAGDAGEQVPDVYRSLNFRSLQDPYSHGAGDTMASRYSTLRADDLESMLNGGLERFYKKYNHLSRKINLQLPTPEVRFENLSFSVQVPAEAGAYGTVGSHLASIFTPWQKVPMTTKHALHPMSGIIKPGSMTLILANPGAGKSTFLKALAGKLQDNKQTEIGGEILYSGLRGDEIDLIKLVGLVDQMDNHIPTLTVRETFKFADMCVNGRPEDQPEEMRDIAALRTELFTQILGLEECADTVVGDALLRGVSGGERKRVTIGEVLVGGQSLFLCDEISTGLDSAATFDIVKSMRTWCKTLGGSVVIALLQPTPEVVEMFDDILMVNEGYMVYHGPRTEILNYFEEHGFTCPPRVDPADFLIEVTSGRGHRYSNGTVPNKNLPVTSEDFNNLFCQSHIYRKTHEAISKGFNEHQFESPEDFKKAKSVANLARSKEKSEFGLAFLPSTMLLLNRQKLIWLRDPPLLWGKVIEAIIVGLVLGMIYFNVSSTYYLRMIFFSIALFQRQAWQQITISFQLRKVFYKQRARNFFRTNSYAIAESVVQIPVNLIVSFILGTFFYFMSGLTRTFEKYIVFFLVLVCFQHAISAYMTMLSALSPSITVGQALASISVSFFLLFSGNIILADLIPDYWIWMYWFSPISWALRSNMLSEFSSDRYTPVESRTLLDSFSISQGTEYIWFGVIVLLAYYFFFTTLNGLALHFIRYEKYKGVTPKAMTDNAPEEDNVYVQVKTPGAADQASVGAKGGGLPFTPSNLCIKDLDYYVTLSSGEERQLLQKITAHFEPGRMVALMGATGAGKTTLMDVIAGRKTGGRIVGDIYVNGELKDPANFSRITAYCEQMDIHSEAATIYEALVFSANLRLPPNFTIEERMNLVNETLELLELSPIAGEMVGRLSVEQKKRVTIGVEVVSNPSILFLDEPTSGLDARSALIVMRGVQSIARTGRTVLCTIHQPSISIFELFDGLLLLQKGGYTAYFGDLGVDSVKMLEYFASIPGTEEIRPQYNPATYMLEVIGAGIGRDVKDYSVEYKNSELYRKNRERTLELCEVSSEFVRHSTLNYRPIATGFWNQLAELTKKQRFTYWRNPQYNFMRVFLFPIFAIIFGTTFYQLSADSVKRINSHIGLIYNSMDFIGVVNLMTVLEVTCAERAVFYRERMSNYYGPLPYSLSLWFAEIPYLVVVIILFVTIEYWLVGWSDNAGDFFFFLFVFYLYTSTCTYVGQWMSVLMPNEKVANVAVGALSCLFNLFSGYLLPRTAMRRGYKWFTYLMPSSYSLAALVGVQFGDNQDIIAVTSGNTTTDMTVAHYIEITYDFRPNRKYNFMVGLIVIWVVVQLAIYLTLKYVSHLKR
ncbi:pleiotropic drug resistance protein ABC superfamily [Phytophthora sojae]|uniref:Pleiotropic drug resistance protein ABC superfamily n=1 Tax=Phytophthora sojae (strain P6497) TaxID=1094619 RepID=G5ADX1_PHYSP|nr:pleiotropic drug resistance protein ABC superfamily [Phytophthora sojae]EGZ06373.1 pleiotropic drug resistance protein ABC superfamily [Phytophthora sojae]|eukprot:XP_009538270.1 pleiotropic drug resistance protein ABC superfamily [Phytophthora sojae]